MADNCGAETMLAKVVGSCIGGKTSVVACKALGSYLLMGRCVLGT